MSSRSLRPVGPWREFDELHARLDQVLGPWGQNVRTGAWRPLADVTESDDAYVVELEVPGVKREDITVETTGRVLVVSGQTQESERRNRRTGRFEYRASLPANADSDGITAELADGILNVRVPKGDRDKARRVEVTSK